MAINLPVLELITLLFFYFFFKWSFRLLAGVMLAQIPEMAKKKLKGAKEKE